VDALVRATPEASYDYAELFKDVTQAAGGDAPAAAPQQ
jgi:hypothetical protein